jgi:hypothetical protein
MSSISPQVSPNNERKRAGVAMSEQAAKAGFRYRQFIALGWNEQQMLDKGWARPLIHPLEYVDPDGTRINRAFWGWLEINPHIWEAFQKYALQAKRDGRSRYGAYAICERMRWDSDISDKLESYKISNNFRRGLALLAMEVHPELQGYFRTHEFGNRHPLNSSGD